MYVTALETLGGESEKTEKLEIKENYYSYIAKEKDVDFGSDAVKYVKEAISNFNIKIHYF